MEIVCECKNCNHSGTINLQYSLKNIHTVIDKIKCSQCSSKNIELYYEDKLIYAYSNRTECAVCGNPIIEPRKNATNSDLCYLCAEDETENENKTKKTTRTHHYASNKTKVFQVDKNTKRCPKCHAPLEIRWNRKNNSEFYGCANYPACDYTEPLK